MNPLAYNLIEVLLVSHCERLTDRCFKRDPCPVKLRQELLAYEFAFEEFKKFCKEE